MISKSRIFPPTFEGVEAVGVLVMVAVTEGLVYTTVFFSPGLDNLPAAFSKGFFVST